MPPERLPPDDPKEWLNRANSNLLRAYIEQPGVYLEDLCFDAQQAAEKALKALLIHRGVRFPYVHDINRLLELLHQDGLTIPDNIRLSASLNDYAVGSRYPGLTEPISREEYLEALALAEAVLHWVEAQI